MFDMYDHMGCRYTIRTEGQDSFVMELEGESDTHYIYINSNEMMYTIVNSLERDGWEIDDVRYLF